MCEFCKNIKTGLLRETNSTNYIGIRKLKEEYHLLYNNSNGTLADMGIKIKFCPMCGQNLSEVSENDCK